MDARLINTLTLLHLVVLIVLIISSLTILWGNAATALLLLCLMIKPNNVYHALETHTLNLKHQIVLLVNHITFMMHKLMNV